jgi:hypothetical protein
MEPGMKKAQGQGPGLKNFFESFRCGKAILEKFGDNSRNAYLCGIVY